MDLSIQPTVNTPASFNLVEVTWESIRKEVAAKNQELYEVIELLSPDKKLTLFKARYPFGAYIIDNGTLNLPHKSGKVVSIKDAHLDEKIKKKLSYSPIPLTLLLNKSIEVFVHSEDRVIPLKIMPPGTTFGLFEVINILSGIQAEPIWSVSSGARSIFMLPKITDKIGYQRLRKELNITINAPRTLADHLELFTLISNHSNFINDWFNDVLFFTDAWFTKSYKDPKWAVFYNYLFRESNVHSQPARDERVFNLTWQCFAQAMSSRNLRPRPYLADTAKHLMAVTIGVLPAFKPCDQNQLAAPTKLLQDIFINSYGLKNYLPTIMYPHNLMMGYESIPVYYSLAFPSLLEGSSLHKAAPDVMADLREVKHLVETFYAAIHSGKVNLPKAHNILKTAKYEYFHSGKDIYNEIKSSKEMPLGDPRLVLDKELTKDRVFCTSSPFLSGCIRITVA